MPHNYNRYLPITSMCHPRIYMRLPICICIGAVIFTTICFAQISGETKVFVVPFSHLDLFWAGTREECLSRGNRIISKAVQIARAQPAFRFLIEDNVFVQNYVETRVGTVELEQFRDLVRAGRIEIAPKWAGIYQNLPRGEAHVRNHLIGKRFARDVFGVDPQVCHLGDLPGYTAQYPQILSKSSIPFMVMTRMGPSDCSLFRWRAPDGSTVLVWYSLKGYGWGITLGLHREMGPNDFVKALRDIEQVRATTKGPIYLGWGTDLWAPSSRLVDNIKLLNEKLSPIRFQLATALEYFMIAAKETDVPVYAGEIPSSWANIITSLSHLWPPVIAATDTLISAEKFAAINHALGYAQYPQTEFDRLWKLVLQSMDHNNYGQGGDIGDMRKLEYAQITTLCAGQILRDMLRNIAERVQIPHTRGTPIVVFNPLNWTRDDVVHAHVSLYGDVSAGDIPHTVHLVDEFGTPVPFYEEQSSGTVSRAREIVFVARNIPSFGYRTYYVVPADKPDSFPPTSKLKLDSPDPAKPKRIFGFDELETDYYQVQIDRVTGQMSIFDKELGRPIATNVELVAVEMRGGDSLSKIPRSGRILPNTVRKIQVEENNSVRTILRLDCDLAGVNVTQRLTFWSALKRIDIENAVDWPQNKFLQIELHFHYCETNAVVQYGVPFGSVASTELFPNSGPRAGDEVPYNEWKTWRQFQDWVFAGTIEGGLTIAADRQFVTLGDGVLRFGMLRGTYSSLGVTRANKPFLVQVPPAGKYVFRYTLTSGKGDWRLAKSYRIGMAFANPLIAVTSVDELAVKPLPPTHSFCSIDADNIVVSALKKAEQDNELVLRLVEMEGRSVTASIKWMGRPIGIRKVNMLEEQAEEKVQELLDIQPFEIVTARLASDMQQR